MRVVEVCLGVWYNQLRILEFDGEIFMKSFENIIPRDFQGGVFVLKDGQVVFEYCQGNADHSTNTPFTSHTTITLASLSKQFVAAAIFLQIEQGKLSLDARNI